jgi:GcpE protein
MSRLVCPSAQTFTPLVEKCKALGRAMRIGTNHGSLSARILSYYGDTPAGMVQSAFEFAEICRDLDYHNFLFSMKASNPLVMVQAYRLLAEEQYARGWDYPLHLGVTEVGLGMDGHGDVDRPGGTARRIWALLREGGGCERAARAAGEAAASRSRPPRVWRCRGQSCSACQMGQLCPIGFSAARGAALALLFDGTG